MEPVSNREVFSELVGPRLRALRHEKGWSIDDVAMIADVSRSLVAGVETGVQVPRGDSLIKIMAVLGATLDDIAGDYYGLYQKRADRLAETVTELDPSKLLGRRGALPQRASAARSGDPKPVRASSGRRRSTKAAEELDSAARSLDTAAKVKKASRAKAKRSDICCYPRRAPHLRLRGGEEGPPIETDYMSEHAA